MATLTTLFITTSMQFGLPQGLLQSVCWVESNHNPNAVHYHDGDGHSIGLCQIKLKTARFMGYRGTEKGLLNPQVNMRYAAAYLRYQIKRYHGNTTKAIIAYNIGNAKGLQSTSYSDTVIRYWGTLNARLQHPNKSRKIAASN